MKAEYRDIGISFCMSDKDVLYRKRQDHLPQRYRTVLPVPAACPFFSAIYIYWQGFTNP
jgi:hypothetical protein